MNLSSRILAAIAVFHMTAMTAGAAWAWGAVGHATVGEIAQGYLKPAAAKQVALLLKADLNAEGQPSGRTTLGEVASWPDEIRGKPAGCGKDGWHYEDIPVCGTATPTQMCPDGQCAPQELQRLIKVLKNKHLRKRGRNEALKWIVHLIGDIHQPLHSSDRDDHGGNKVQVSFAGDSSLTLHHIWDTELVERVMQEEAGGQAAFVAAPISAADKSAWEQGSIDDWVAESHALAVSFVYPELPGGFACDRVILDRLDIPDSYASAAAPIISTQLRRAGVRLAAVLNTALAPPAP